MFPLGDDRKLSQYCLLLNEQVVFYKLNPDRNYYSTICYYRTFSHNLILIRMIMFCYRFHNLYCLYFSILDSHILGVLACLDKEPVFISCKATKISAQPHSAPVGSW